MLSDNIRTIRKTRGFTQEELAARLHVTRQTISKWEKGYSVPDAELLSRMAEVLEVPVTELLGAPSQPVSDPDPIVEQLSRLNEQLAVRNRRAARVWKIAGIVLIALVLIPVILTALFSFRAEGGGSAENAAGSIRWVCTLDGESYTCGVEYTKKYQIISGFSDADTELADRVAGEGVDPASYWDARQAQTALYDWFESRGGTVEVLYRSGLALPER